MAAVVGIETGRFPSQVPVVTPSRLVVVVPVVIPPYNKGRPPPSRRTMTIHQREVVEAPAPEAGTIIPAATVLLVVVAPAAVTAETVRVGWERAVVAPPARMVAAVVVVLVLAVEMRPARVATRSTSKAVTAARGSILQLVGRHTCTRVVEEEEAVLTQQHTPLALQPEAAPMRVMVLDPTVAVTAAKVASTATEALPAAPQTVPRTPVKPAMLIVVVAVVVVPLVAFTQDSQIPALVGPALLLLDINRT